MAQKKRVPSMESEDKAFFMNAYEKNPAARKAMDEEMKRRGLTYEQYFGVKPKKKK